MLIKCQLSSKIKLFEIQNQIKKYQCLTVSISLNKMIYSFPTGKTNNLLCQILWNIILDFCYQLQIF